MKQKKVTDEKPITNEKQMKNNIVLLFLGSGATAGSGITKNGISLPTDQNFFDDADDRKGVSKIIEQDDRKGVSKIIKQWENAYPALNLCREKISIIKVSSLYQTWNQLFIFRGLARAGLLEDKNLIKEFEKLKGREWPQDYQWRETHYLHQFEIMKQGPKLYYLAELAIWDLRVLVKELYSELNNQNNNQNDNYYKTLNEKLGEALNKSIVINLNYDTTFDDFNGEGFSPFEEKEKLCENLKKKIIRPHGSLKWISKCYWSLNSNGWIQPWEETFEDINLENQGYQRTSHAEKLIFHQSNIVPPAYFKEEIIGNSTMPGLASQVLWNQWRHMEIALRQAEEIIFYGTSLASGDDHLNFMTKKHSKDKKIKVIGKKESESQKNWENGWRDRFPMAYIKYDYA